ncbi:MAG TPA: cell division protein FtsQ/DivIB [Usitatibacter sp.]|nr:cell division protein FtsQ/DivIB [Usitatibacter sp.]
MSAAPRLRTRFLHGVAALVVAIALCLGAWHGYRAVVELPVTRVVYAGEVDRLAQAELDALSHAVIAADRPSLEAVSEAARRMPWVRDAAVRRLYPDAVEITLEVHEPLARWNDDRLVSRRGEVFAATGAGTLPRFRGPEGSAARMTREFPLIAAALEPLGAIEELRLSPRGGWQARLAGGLAVELGRDDWPVRARRFLAAWQRLPEEARATRYADLRYPNGFALRKTSTTP